MPKRESGPDLLRCVALLFVVVFHSFLHNGYYWHAQSGLAMVLCGGLRWLSASCIGIFLMLTGYLKAGKTGFAACCRSLPPVLLGYLLAAAISIPIRHYLLGDVQSFSVWLSRLVSFRGVSYGWYVEMYVGLTLLSPYVNLLLKQLQTPRQLLALAGVMLAMTALPGATPYNIVPDHWRSLYPLTYYILGAVFRRLQPKLPGWIGLGAAALTALLLGTATVLSTDGSLNEAFTQEFADLWITVIAVCLFAALYRVQVRPAVERLLAFGAGGCYGGYLLSHLLDAWCYSLVPQWHTPERYPLLFVSVTLPIFIASILCGVLLRQATALLFKRKGAV